MQFSYEKPTPISIRVPTLVSKSKNLQLWDEDNCYPQRAEEAIKHSHTLRGTVNSVADFLAGDGFEDPAIGGLIVSDSGPLKKKTLNKVLRKVCEPYSRFETLPLHIGYDTNFRISSIDNIKVKYVRFPVADDSGRFDYFWYSTNWEADTRKEKSARPIITPYHAFNPDPAVVAQQIAEDGGIEEYGGQLLFLTPEDYEYPLATFDAVMEAAQTQGELILGKLAYAQNGMMATMAIKFDGEFESQKEEDDWKALIKRKKGARNMNSNIGIQDKQGTKSIKDMFANLQPANLDRLFEYTETSSITAILENEGWPKILIGVQAEGTLFNQESMVDAYTYANAKTRNHRRNISEVFSLLLSYWATPITSPATIREKVYGAAAAPATAPTAGAAGTGTTSLTDGAPDSPRINSILTNLTGGQRKAMDGILTRYKNGKYSWPIMRAMMRLSVGLTDADLAEMFPNEAPAKEL